MNPESEIIFRRFVSKARFRHAQLLIYLHELGSMKRAAEALGVSQPAVSLMISELEMLLGLPLFLRHARGVTPTPVSEQLLPIARRIILALGEGSEVVSDILNRSAGYVRIAATPAAAGGILHPAIGLLIDKFPRVHVEIYEIGVEAPMRFFSDGLCDILACREPDIMPENGIFKPCCTDALVVICGATHPLAAKGKASNRDLAEQRWIVSRRGSIARRHFETTADQIGLPAENRIGVVTHIPTLTLELLTKQQFLTVVPRSVATPWIRDGLAIELETKVTKELPPLGLLCQTEGNKRIIGLVASAIISTT